MQNFDSRIAEILNNFDFVLCRNVMLLTGWKWGWRSNVTTPCVEELKEEALRLLKDAANTRPEDVYYSISSGGFYAIRAYGNLDLFFGDKFSKNNPPSSYYYDFEQWMIEQGWKWISSYEI